MTPTVAPRAGRVAAVGVVACAALHVPLLLMHGGDSVALAILMGIAVAGCLSCAPHLARRPTIRTWAVCGLLSGAMVAVHLALLMSSASPMRGGHPGHAIPTTLAPVSHVGHDSGWAVALFWAATTIAVAQVLTAATVVRRAGRIRLQPSAIS
ncbi:hypothetical protein ACFSBZ_00865 [Amnibacterium flavum]|uniref:Uncharacterized protein n=1 Tax=Amnibacterium flavum TaxID=2173173 RepID=A0A2V1HRD3_9MICO|nr:hypothetical protein [Amnibacterium flavum]PVZ93530.1 hypothetical protein DDQ50_14520 [Amnibacterium flavum]